jgi:hypothetical protein
MELSDIYSQLDPVNCTLPSHALPFQSNSFECFCYDKGLLFLHFAFFFLHLSYNGSVMCHEPTIYAGRRGRNQARGTNRERDAVRAPGGSMLGIMSGLSAISGERSEWLIQIINEPDDPGTGVPGEEAVYSSTILSLIQIASFLSEQLQAIAFTYCADTATSIVVNLLASPRPTVRPADTFDRRTPFRGRTACGFVTSCRIFLSLPLYSSLPGEPGSPL